MVFAKATSVLAVLLFLYCWGTTCSSTPGILETPKSKNITLGEPVTLICIATGIAIEWKTNPSLNITQMKKNMTVLNVTNHISTLKGTVELVGSSYTNNITVWCIAIGSSGTGTDESEKAHIFVQGLLESVSNLTVTPFNSTTVLITWSPPFTLEGVPILGYKVTITNTTSQENETMLVKDTTLLYSIDHPDFENNFTVTVVPINEIGAGQPGRTSVQFLMPEPEKSSRSLASSQWTTSNSLILSKNMILLSHTTLSFDFQTSEPLVPENPDEAVITASVVLSISTCLLVILTIAIIVVCVRRHPKNVCLTHHSLNDTSEIDDHTQRFTPLVPIIDRQQGDDKIGEHINGKLEYHENKIRRQEDGIIEPQKKGDEGTQGHHSKPLLQRDPSKSLPPLGYNRNQHKNRHLKRLKSEGAEPDDDEIPLLDKQDNDSDEETIG